MCGVPPFSAPFIKNALMNFDGHLFGHASTQVLVDDVLKICNLRRGARGV